MVLTWRSSREDRLILSPEVATRKICLVRANYIIEGPSAAVRLARRALDGRLASAASQPEEMASHSPDGETTASAANSVYISPTGG